MGRPKGDAARSKSRPSSSSLAASLLPSGATTVGFGGYVGSSRVESSVSAEAPTSFLDIDGEVAQHLKRLSRKDPTTKLKALTALSQLLKEKSAKEIAPIIPQWGFEYKKLLLDYNREVRRATHDTMTSFVCATGRELAPHIKSLMGPWWFSQFDSSYEVSQAAKRSFQAAFPAQEKRLDALILCVTEIFMYLEENLKLTPQSMSDKVTAADELEEMHQQVISSSLLALATLIDVLISLKSERPGFENIRAEPKNALKARESAVTHAEKLFSSYNYFLDFLKSQSPAIRSAVYSVLRSFIKNLPHAVDEGNIKLLAAAILGAFQEKDPTCHAPMWDAIFLFCQKFPDCWEKINVQKTILNRFWHFLKNGCFGSQQISYPSLVLFLEVVPPRAVVGEKFILEFFQNLWHGRFLSHSLNAERVAFFLAVKECFLWALRNVSRYSDGLDAIHHLQHTLIDQILLKLMWHEYFLFHSPNDHDRILSGVSPGSSGEKIQPVNQESKHPLVYAQDLGKCIVDILSGISSVEHNLLSVFSSRFQEQCLEIFPLENSSENVGVLIRFLLALDHYAVSKGETWPLEYLVGPTLAKSFPLIKTLDSPDAVKFMATATSIFCPRNTIDKLIGVGLDKKQFLLAYNEIFIPWCLQDWSASTSSKLDFLLALIDDGSFREQWNSIITYAIDREGLRLSTLDAKLIQLLAVLVEKARERIRKGKHLQEWQLDYCQNELLDIAAFSIINANPPYGTFETRFLRALIGGTTEDEGPFLSKDTLHLIFKEVQRKLLDFIGNSNFAWIKHASSLLPVNGKQLDTGPKSSVDVIEMARFAFEVLTGSLFSLKVLNDESEVIHGILAIFFFVEWEYNCIASVSNDEVGEECARKNELRMSFCESVHASHAKVKSELLRRLSNCSCTTLRAILIQSVQCAIFREDILDDDTITTLCCLWLLEIMECLCQDQFEEQKLLDEFLIGSDYWPSWVMPDISSRERLVVLKTDYSSIQKSGHQRIVLLVNKLISKIGFHGVVGGYVPDHSPSLSMESSLDLNSQLHPRAWLAAEMLCTWNWEGGSALSSFLPMMSSYVKNEDCPPTEGFVDSVVSILLDGALAHGENVELTSQNVWPASYDEAECIGEPFLRALVSLLSTLFHDNIWGKGKATSLFRLLRDKLYIGETLNLNCLNILPACMDVLIRPLNSGSEGDHLNTSEETEVHDTILHWLKRVEHFPPLYAWETGKDMESWFQLAMSCYPVRATKGVQGLGQGRDISAAEKHILFELLRKQRHDSGASAVVNKLPMVQMLLAKLLLVSAAYCWEEFSEDDWEFVLYRFRWWIESSVVIMEEIAENINDAIANYSSYNDLEVTLKKVELAVSCVDSSVINLARCALVGFSFFSSLVGKEKKEDSVLRNPLRVDRWEITKDRILECILRLFFSTGVAEAIAGSCNGSSSIIAASRLEHSQFWELVALHVTESSSHARDKAIKSVELWSLIKGPISSLYAILFSSKPLPCLQFAAFVILSSEKVAHLAFVREESLGSSEADVANLQGSVHPDFASEGTFHFREEVSFMFGKLSCEVLEMDLLASERVNFFLAWALLLSHLVSLPSSSPAREKMIQYVQDTADSAIIDCLFQHIPLDSLTASSLKKKEHPATISNAATAATLAITSASLVFSVKSLWPVAEDKMSLLAGAIFGLTLCVLPAYVREWFSNIRDRSKSAIIESFTKTWCSPRLIMNELNQINKADFADENFSLSVSKSANEVVATYTKDETTMDLVIRLPASYPLRPVDVDCTKSLGISDMKQRKWLMSLMLFVRNQNGALAEGIRIWKSNFDKAFEGVEECPICYSVIHTTNHSLPRLACKTCRHKFHSACLYKWFSTSHKSTCPLCQSPF